MGDHLRADIERIRDSASRLATVKAEFDAAGKIGDRYRPFLGSGELAGKMDDFSNNWSYHREKLSGSIETLGTWCKAAADGYTGVDDQLAQALRDAESKG